MKRICFALICALASMVGANAATAQNGSGVLNQNQCQLVRLRAGCVCTPGPRGEAIISCRDDNGHSPPPVIENPVRPRPGGRSCAIMRIARGCTCTDLPGGGVDVKCGSTAPPAPDFPFPPRPAQSCAAVTIPVGCLCRTLPGGGVDISCNQPAPRPIPPTLAGCARVLPPEGCLCRDTPQGARIVCAHTPRPPIWRPHRPWRPHTPPPRPRPYGGGWGPYAPLIR